MRTRVLALSISLVAAAAWGQSSPQVPPRANEGSGAAIVAGKGKCLTCHRILDIGSRIGPDLTDIGANRTLEQIQTSLVDPDAEILPENRSYRVVTRDGASITGVLLNHDTFQVLMRDPKDQLRSFTKSELREHGFVAASPMPSYRSTLSGEELADVVAYLASLKGVLAQ
jgi:putative heme-binding domain-containing protein